MSETSSRRSLRRSTSSGSPAVETSGAAAGSSRRARRMSVHQLRAVLYSHARRCSGGSPSVSCR